jgi:hypothetical protein
MPQSKTRLMHTCPTERPFYCITGDLSGEGFLVVVDKSTHDLVVQEGAEAGTVSVIVNPKGVQVKSVSARPGTRMLDLSSPSSDPMWQAAESVEELRRDHITREIAASARRGVRLASRRRRGHAIGDPRVSNAQVLPEGED